MVRPLVGESPEMAKVELKNAQKSIKAFKAAEMPNVVVIKHFQEIISSNLPFTPQEDFAKAVSIQLGLGPSD